MHRTGSMARVLAMEFASRAWARQITTDTPLSHCDTSRTLGPRLDPITHGLIDFVPPGTCPPSDGTSLSQTAQRPNTPSHAMHRYFFNTVMRSNQPSPPLAGAPRRTSSPIVPHARQYHPRAPRPASLRFKTSTLRICPHLLLQAFTGYPCLPRRCPTGLPCPSPGLRALRGPSSTFQCPHPSHARYPLSDQCA